MLYLNLTSPSPLGSVTSVHCFCGDRIGNFSRALYAISHRDAIDGWMSKNKFQSGATITPQLSRHHIDIMESFERIYLDLSKQPGKCRIAETGLGWKPSGGGDTFTLDANNIQAAQWSRAAKGYELKILSRNAGVIQLDGFEQEVNHPVHPVSSNSCGKLMYALGF